jgi:hypothetical protein
MSPTQLSLFQGDEPSPTTDKCRLLKDALQSAIHEMEKAEQLVGERLWNLKDCLEATSFTEARKTLTGIAALTTDLKDELSIQTTQQAVTDGT